MLPAGNYTLSVKACNSQGVWSPHIKELKIKILPPWWRTWWAYTIYTGIVLCIILLIIRNLRSRHKQKQIMQAIEVENEKQQKINNMKLQFFANISHELRTPLSLIINPLEEFFVDHPEYRKGDSGYGEAKRRLSAGTHQPIAGLQKARRQSRDTEMQARQYSHHPERDISFLRPDSTETEHRLQLYQLRSIPYSWISTMTRYARYVPTFCRTHSSSLPIKEASHWTLP